MHEKQFFFPLESPALRFAEKRLAERGFDVANVISDRTTHIVLPVPTKVIPENLPHCAAKTAIIGGNLSPLCAEYRCRVDLLQDPQYLCENAAITSECALRLLLDNLPVRICGCPILIIGWGRIGKTLSLLLQKLGAEITVAARRPEERALAEALEFRTADPASLACGLIRFRAVINTVPHMILDQRKTQFLRPDCVKIDLASVPGIAGDGVIAARGLPGKMMPEASGNLIAKTIIRLTSTEVV